MQQSRFARSPRGARVAHDVVMRVNKYAEQSANYLALSYIFENGGKQIRGIYVDHNSSGKYSQ